MIIVVTASTQPQPQLDHQPYFDPTRKKEKTTKKIKMEDYLNFSLKNQNDDLKNMEDDLQKQNGRRPKTN